jgi:predicted NACHT family NTPase
MERWDLALREDEPSDDRNRHLGFAIRSAPWDELAEERATVIPADPLHRRRAGAQWRRIVSRERIIEIAKAAFPKEKPWRRVGLVCGAGLGKTTNLQWLQAAVNRSDSFRGRQLAYFRELVGLPRSPKALLNEMVEDIGSVGAESDTRVALQRMLTAGRVTFLLDSLDQANPDPKGADVQSLTALCQGAWKECPVWISGRPYAFQMAREKLESVNPQDPWRFLRIGPLDEPECRQLLETTQRR